MHQTSQNNCFAQISNVEFGQEHQILTFVFRILLEIVNFNEHLDEYELRFQVLIKKIIRIN